MDRFYMTELKAPAAERAYREHSSRGKQDCHVTIRVHGACGVIENLFIGDQPIQAWLKANGAEQRQERDEVMSKSKATDVLTDPGIQRHTQRSWCYKKRNGRRGRKWGGLWLGLAPS